MTDERSYRFGVLDESVITEALTTHKEFTRLPEATQESILGVYANAVIGQFTFPGVMSSMREFGDAMSSGREQLHVALQEKQQTNPEGILTIGYLVLINPEHFDDARFVRTAYVRPSQTLEALDDTFAPTVVYGLKGVSGAMLDVFARSFNRLPRIGEYFGKNLVTERSPDLAVAAMTLSDLLKANHDTQKKPKFDSRGKVINDSE